MIRINWDEVEATKIRLRRAGASDNSKLAIIVIYHSSDKSNQYEISLQKLDETLFKLCNDRSIKSIFVFDREMRKAYLKFKGAERANVLENILGNGHPSVLVDFQEMSSSERDVWVKISIAQLQNFLMESSEYEK